MGKNNHNLLKINQTSLGSLLGFSLKISIFEIL